MPISYYIICLVSNVMLMSLYAVQVYSPHQTCIVNGKNITQHFDLAFRLGFAILFADFFNLNVISLFSNNSDDSARYSSGFSQKSSASVTKSVAFDWLIKVLTLLISGL